MSGYREPGYRLVAARAPDERGKTREIDDDSKYMEKNAFRAVMHWIRGQRIRMLIQFSFLVVNERLGPVIAFVFILGLLSLSGIDAPVRHKTNSRPPEIQRQAFPEKLLQRTSPNGASSSSAVSKHQPATADYDALSFPRDSAVNSGSSLNGAGKARPAQPKSTLSTALSGAKEPTRETVPAEHDGQIGQDGQVGRGNQTGKVARRREVIGGGRARRTYAFNGRIMEFEESRNRKSNTLRSTWPDLMCQTIKGRARWPGYIYGFRLPGLPNLIKIGMVNRDPKGKRPLTSRAVDERLEALGEKYGCKVEEVFRSEKLLAVYRIEAILHRILAKDQLIEVNCPCGSRHREWFEIPDAGIPMLKSLLRRCEDFSNSKPYDRYGRLITRWCVEVERVRAAEGKSMVPGRKRKVGHKVSASRSKPKRDVRRRILPSHSQRLGARI